MHSLPGIVISLCIVIHSVGADVVDPDSTAAPPPLRELAEALHDVEVDVLLSHDSEAGQAGPSFGDRPRVAPLVGFEAWSRAADDLGRYERWLDAFERGVRGAIAAAPTDRESKSPSLDEFKDIWDAAEGRRIVITFDEGDVEAAKRVADVLEDNGYAVYLAMASPPDEPLDPELLGALFVEADHALVIDTTSARLNGVVHFEAELLAELRRQREWIAADDEGLPPVKRESMDVIEALGVLPMQVLPGGIVLGKTPRLDAGIAGAVFAFNGSDYGLEIDGTVRSLVEVSAETREAIQAFVAAGDTHSVVDIAGGEVTLTPSFRETRIGQRMIKADRQPFEHLSVDGAQKSLIVDAAILLRRDGDELVADVGLEVRFYRRDDEGHADRIATLRFTVQDATGSARLLDLAWSRRPDRKVGFDGEGATDLVDGLEQCALDAALIAVARVRASDGDS